MKRQLAALAVALFIAAPGSAQVVCVGSGCSGGSGGSSGASYLTLNTAQTPDSLFLATPSTSNGVIIGETADVAFDFAHPLQTTPSLFVHSSTQSTTQFASLTHNGTDAILTSGAGDLKLTKAADAYFSVKVGGGTGRLVYASGEGLQLTNTYNDPMAGLLLSIGTNVNTQQDRMVPGQKLLTESTATAFVTINIPNDATGPTGGLLIYTVEANDASDYQVRSGMIPFAGVNKAGTETCTVGTPAASTEVVAVSTGTLAVTFACDTSVANGFNLTANAVSSLTQTTLQMNYRVIKIMGSGTIGPMY